jgi:hypothetical protein
LHSIVIKVAEKLEPVKFLRPNQGYRPQQYPALWSQNQHKNLFPIIE